MEMHGWTEEQAETMMEWTHDYFHGESLNWFNEKWGTTNENMGFITTMGTEIIPPHKGKMDRPPCNKEGCDYPRSTGMEGL